MSALCVSQMIFLYLKKFFRYVTWRYVEISMTIMETTPKMTTRFLIFSFCVFNPSSVILSPSISPRIISSESLIFYACSSTPLRCFFVTMLE